MILKQSFPFALLVLLMTFYNRLDPVMLESLLGEAHGNEQAGIYASGFRLLDAANMIAYLFSVLLIPIFSKMIKDRKSVEQMLKLAFTLLITLAVIVSSLSLFYSQELMALLYKSHIEASAGVFRLLMGGFIAVSTSYIFGTLLTANGNLKELNIISAGGLVINFTLNLLLIPRLMALGSAWASLITQFSMAVIQVILVQRIFRFQVNYRYLLSLLVFAAGVTGFNILSRLIPMKWSFVPENHGWLVNFTLVFLLSFGLAALLRLFNVRSLFRILRGDR
jgi:O-antigen/teichoic acid export membrane protein